MQSASYAFIACNKPGAVRPRLMSTWTLAGFAVLVIILLIMIYPKPAVLRQASQARLGDPLAANYLANLLKTDPANLALRLLLARHKLHLHETDGFVELLEPVMRNGNPDQRAEAMLTQYQLLIEQSSGERLSAEQTESLRQQRIHALETLHKQPLPLQSLMYLAKEAEHLQQPSISAALYRKISRLSGTMPAQQLADSAAAAHAENNLELAAHLYFIARHRAQSLTSQRTWFLAGVRALIAGGRHTEAMQAIDLHLGTLADDPETLYFLIQIARAANDQARAVEYAKRMLRLSWGHSLATWIAGLDLSLIGIASANADDVIAPSSPDTIQSYNKKKYELAYQVFVENGKLNEAFRVAEAAVKQAPDEAIWHQRLAQIAEWTAQPMIALREWRWLLAHDENKNSLQKVLGLAKSLNDFDVALDAWKKRAARESLNAAQWRHLADLFELTGRPREGVRFFEARYAAEREPLYLEIAAQLAERIGDDEHAMAVYARLLDRHGNQADWQLKLANLHLRKGHYRAAYDLLQAHRHEARDEDAAYWKVLSDLSWALQQDAGAEQNLRHLQATGQLAQEDFSRLIFLLGDTRQTEKAELAELAYQRFGDWEMLLLALELRTATRDVLAQKRLIERAVLHHQTELSGSALFYRLRAQYFQTMGRVEAARMDLGHAITLAPDDADTLNTALWFWIDARDLPALRAMTARLAARGVQDNPAYWQALGVAYQVLDQPRRAVAYYRRQFKQGKRDVLWLSNFADALDQARQPANALRIRQHVWRLLRAGLADMPVESPYSSDMLLAARLALMQHPDDSGLALVRSVVQQERQMQHEHFVRHKVNGMSLAWATTLGGDEAENAVDELVLGWALSTEQSANAKAWLWRRYGQRMAGPQWAVVPAAMAENDSPVLAERLAHEPGDMSMLMRHDVARAIGQERHAQTTVFSGLVDDPDNDEAHQRLVEDALAVASHIDLELKKTELGNLHGIARGVKVALALSTRLKVGAEFRQTHQASDVPLNFGNTPPIETVMGFRLENHGELGNSEILLQRRRESARTTTVQAHHAIDILPRLNLRLGAEVNADAPESAELLVFGMRDQIEAGLLYRFSLREYVQLDTAGGRYYLQSGELLGSGQTVSWELGHMFRTQNPDLKMRLNGVHARFSSDANAAFALPEDVNIYSLCLGTGELPRPVYSRAWRLAADACATRNDIGGSGYNLAFGLAGSVVGRDQLSLSILQGSGGSNLTNALIREFILNYRYFY